jgi:acyl-CoA thioesterase-1
MVFGDSLVAGYDIPLEKAFPAQLEKRLKEDGYDAQVINAGVSGDTTSGGLTRLDWTMTLLPDYVILELGANDMLRGINPEVTKENLRKMLSYLQEHHIPVLLAGIKAFPNLGPKYVKAYDEMYPALAKEFKTAYYPFFMEGVALHRELTLEDGLHPNPQGIEIMVNNILPSVEKMLDSNSSVK